MTLRLTRFITRAMFAWLTLAAVGMNANAQTQGAPVALRIGYQKSSTLITILKARGSLDKALAPLGVRLSWNEFVSGLPLTEALNADAVQCSADCADTVPVFAQAS